MVIACLSEIIVRNGCCKVSTGKLLQWVLVFLEHLVSNIREWCCWICFVFVHLFVGIFQAKCKFQIIRKFAQSITSEIEFGIVEVAKINFILSPTKQESIRYFLKNNVEKFLKTSEKFSSCMSTVLSKLVSDRYGI